MVHLDQVKSVYLVVLLPSTIITFIAGNSIEQSQKGVMRIDEPVYIGLQCSYMGSFWVRIEDSTDFRAQLWLCVFDVFGE